MQEFDKHHQQPSKYVKLFKGFNKKTGTEFTCDVGYERFLGPEIFFNPEIYSPTYTTPLPQVGLGTALTCHQGPWGTSGIGVGSQASQTNHLVLMPKQAHSAPQEEHMLGLQQVQHNPAAAHVDGPRLRGKGGGVQGCAPHAASGEVSEEISASSARLAILMPHQKPHSWRHAFC